MDAAKSLDDNGVRTITIGVGTDAKPGALEKMTPTKKDSVKIDPTTTAEKLAGIIMNKVLTGKFIWPFTAQE